MDKNTDLAIDFYVIEQNFNADTQQCLTLLEERKDVLDFAKMQILTRKKTDPEAHEKIENQIKTSHNKRMVDKGKMRTLTSMQLYKA